MDEGHRVKQLERGGRADYPLVVGTADGPVAPVAEGRAQAFPTGQHQAVDLVYQHGRVGL
jgi:hypothetical protein